MNKVYAFFLVILTSTLSLSAQKNKSNENYVNAKYLDAITWRNIGPFRGGRSAAVTGVEGVPNLFYMGSTGGGVWKTTDAGNTWENISDGFFGSSIGAISVSQSDNNVIYVGQGEETVRGNTSFGLGMWKSIDAGKTWFHIGLDNSKHISRIRIHPDNPSIVWVAVLGDLYKDTEERGVYKTTDGGKTWNKVLFSDASSGAVDLILDPNNPRIAYASTWTIRRTPYSLSSGGKGSKLWKSTDYGETWKEISTNEGFPKGLLGIIGITVSKANSNILYAMVENQEKGGLYKSSDAGKTWTYVSDNHKLRQRAWYYTRLYADPKDVDKLYVLNVGFHVSKDGGKTFNRKSTPHGDHHDLWIAPENPDRMILGDDGGAQISFDGGDNWTTYYNQPTAQFYRVNTDDHWPFRIYGAQQDNSSIRIDHRSYGPFIDVSNWENTAGGEAGHHAINPMNEDEVFGGEYGGYMMRFNHKSKEVQATHVWPDNPLGHGVEDMKYRFQWNYPIFFSPNDPSRLYAASNHLHLSTNGGRSWTVISPDLTTNTPEKQVASGGPITKDNTGVEYYCTIFAAQESSLEPGVIWTGSDDGLIHITKDGGSNWENVTPKQMPDWMQINSIEVDPFNKGGLYVAGTKYKSGDYNPYLYYTNDYGKSWKLIVNGIPENHFTRVIRSDFNREGLLYVGTEFGIYISFNNGENWQPFQQNLPIVPITDLKVKNEFLIAATQGRSFWIIDDLTPLYSIEKNWNVSNFLFPPKQTVLMPAAYGGKSKTRGENHPNGAIIHYYLENVDTSHNEYFLDIYSSNHQTPLRTFSSKSKNKESKWVPKKGSNRFIWDLRAEGVETIKNMILWSSLSRGPFVLPGDYRIEMRIGEDTLSQKLKLIKDPNTSSTQEELEEQFSFVSEVIVVMNDINECILEIQKTRDQLEQINKLVSDDQLKEKISGHISSMDLIESTLYQTKNKSPQDPLNYPIRLNNKYGHLGLLASIGQNKPTIQMYEVREELESEINTQLQNWESLKMNIKGLNKELKNDDTFEFIKF